MEDLPYKLAELVAKDGPAWLFVLAVIGILIWAIYRFVNMYEKNNDRRISSQEEANRISGQMTEQMARSNKVLEAVEKQLSLMNTTNELLVTTFTESQNRSDLMVDYIKTMAERIEYLYKRAIEH